MPFKMKILSIFETLKPYLLNKQVFTPPYAIFHAFCLALIAKPFGHVLRQYNGGLQFIIQRFPLETSKYYTNMSTGAQQNTFLFIVLLILLYLN